MSVQKKHGGELTEEEFRKFTLYTAKSNNALDDIYRAQILGFTNEKVKIAPGAIVRIGNEQIGKNSYIGLYSYINGNVSIGEYVLIGPHVSIVASNHLYDPESNYFSGRTSLDTGSVVIEDGAWLTSGVVITPGVTIGTCTLVCANSVVTTSTKPYSIVAGSPARVIGKIHPETGAYEWFHKEE